MRDLTTTRTTTARDTLVRVLALGTCLGVAAGVGGASAAAAAGGTAGTAAGEADPAVVLPWDGRADEVIVVDGALWGRVTVVPGDGDTRSVRVRNDGPTAGELTATIVDAAALDAADDPTWVDDAFYDDLTINGVPASVLHQKETLIQTTPLAAGESTDVTLTFAFDGHTGNRTGGGYDEDAGEIVNPDGVGPREFGFDVLLRLAGDAPGPGPEPSPDPSPDPSGTPSEPGDPGPSTPAAPGGGSGGQGAGGEGVADHRAGVTGPLAATGGHALGREGWLLLGAAALVLVAGASAWAARRRAG
ncbi:hypothetical protein [Isoptericola sp. NPDC057653]|uniref:hypothetical protein n=1 Tax=Isoptericola sp. NPDC057653 TaxID=3346195 RepID=UPI0036AC3704